MLFIIGMYACLWLTECVCVCVCVSEKDCLYVCVCKSLTNQAFVLECSEGSHDPVEQCDWLPD